MLRQRLQELSLPVNAEQPPDLWLQRLVDELGDVGADLVQIVGYGEHLRDVRNAAMLLFATSSPAVPSRLRDRLHRSARPALLRALRDHAMPDERKYHLGPIAALCGVELSESELRACFANFDNVRARMEAEVAESLPDSLDLVEQALSTTGLLGADLQAAPNAEALRSSIELGIRMRQLNADVAATLLGVAAACALNADEDGHEAWDGCLDILADTANGRAAWALEALAELPRLPEAWNRPAALAADLQRTGVRLAPPHTGTFSHGIVSGVDGVGSQGVHLFYRTGEGTLDGVHFLLNDELGVKDAWCSFEGGAAVEEQLRAQCRADEVTYAPCTLGLARALVANALAIHAEPEAPLGGRFLLCRPFLGPEPLEPRRREPDLGCYALETYVRGPELVVGSAELSDHPTYGRLWLSSEAAYAFVARTLRKGASPRRTRWRVPAKVLDAFIAEVAEGARETLVRRIAGILEVEALAGKAKVAVHRAAARVWLALREDLVPLRTIPFVRALCERSLRAVDEHLRHGFRSYDAAERAGFLLSASDDEMRPGGDDPFDLPF